MSRKARFSLSSANPELSKEFHSTRNLPLKSNEISPSSQKKVWWKCPEGDDHEWEARPADRHYKKSGCPICNGKKVVASNCLETTHPEVAAQWHPHKNRDKTPFHFTAGSNKKAWWKCPEGDDHEWEARIKDRALKGVGCPICNGKKVVASNCLETTHPEVAAQWHPHKNRDKTPFHFTAGSNKKAWWKCPEGDDHEWEAVIWSRLEKGCPMCASGRMKQVVKSNCLSTTHPDIATQWDSRKNGGLLPEMVSAGSKKKVWWKCPEGDDHEWEASIGSRAGIAGHGCPICSGSKVVTSTCLSITHPELIKEWHPIKNKGVIPEDLSFGSNKKIWWRCDKSEEHVWITSVKNRAARDYGCPFCSLTPQSRQELIITFELMSIFSGINPKGFKTRVGGKIWTIDIYIPHLNLGIEFDGSYWHKDKVALDKLKTKQLTGGGFKIIRIREHPLKAISENDIISSVPYNGKQIVNSILDKISNLYGLTKNEKQLIFEYQNGTELKNTNKLDDYIESILIEKAI